MTIDSFHFHWTSCFISEFTRQSTSVGHPRCLIKVVNECRYIKPLIHTRVGWYGRLSSRLTFIIETSGTLRHCMVISNVNQSIQFEQSKLGWVVRDSSMPMVWIVPVKHWTEPFLEGWEDHCSKANHTQASQKALKDAFWMYSTMFLYYHSNCRVCDAPHPQSSNAYSYRRTMGWRHSPNASATRRQVMECCFPYSNDAPEMHCRCMICVSRRWWWSAKRCCTVRSSIRQHPWRDRILDWRSCKCISEQRNMILFNDLES